MGRWSHLDTDEERLPEGMSRVGYDADTQVYTYRDAAGEYWEGAPGVQYGKLFRVRSSYREAAPPLPSVTIPDDVQGDEASQVLHDYYDDDQNPYPPPVAKPPPRVTTPRRVRLRRSHHRQRASKRLPRLPDDHDVASEKTYEEEEYPNEKDDITTIPELTPSNSHTDDGDSIQKEKDSNNNPVFNNTPHLHRQRRQLERERKQEAATLKRAGTLSRLARYLSRGAGGTAASPNENRGAAASTPTLLGGRLRATPSSASRGGMWKWPSLGGRNSEDYGARDFRTEEKIEEEEIEGVVPVTTTQNTHRRVLSLGSGMSSGTNKRRNRAMTFDELLGRDGRLRAGGAGAA